MKQFLAFLLLVSLAACNAQTGDSTTTTTTTTVVEENTPSQTDLGDHDLSLITKSSAEWKKELSEEEYYVLREHGTERAFTGDLWDHKGKGVYTCRGCQLPLFSSDTKYKSGTGWPSFWDFIKKGHVEEEVDNSYGMKRVEVHCARCKGHLGHVFEDGPKPTGLRYCINSVSLDFVEE